MPLVILRNAYTHPAHPNLQVSLEQNPAGKHANKVWTQARPRLVVYLVELREGIFAVGDVVVAPRDVAGREQGGNEEYSGEGCRELEVAESLLVDDKKKGN